MEAIELYRVMVARKLEDASRETGTIIIAADQHERSADRWWIGIEMVL